MLRKIAFALIALAIAWFAGRALVHALVSDETLIRWKLEDACEGFNRTRMSPILDFIAHDFVEQSSGAHRDDLRAGVASVFFTAKDPETKKFPYVAVVVPDTLTIDLDPAARGRARLRCTIRITDMRGGSERIAWEFKLDGTVVKGDDGWQLVDAHADKVTGDWRL
jgi:methionine-rich copper-binding protein CopC